MKRSIQGISCCRQSSRSEGDDLLEDLRERLMHQSAELALKTLDGLEAGTLEAKPQVGSGHLKPAPRINSETGHLNWNRSARELHNLVRGLSPLPGAWTEWLNDRQRTKVKICRTHPAAGSAEAGLARVEGRELLVGTGEGLLEVRELQPAGKRRMSAEDFINGLRGKKALQFT